MFTLPCVLLHLLSFFVFNKMNKFIVVGNCSQWFKADAGNRHLIVVFSQLRFGNLCCPAFSSVTAFTSSVECFSFSLAPVNQKPTRIHVIESVTGMAWLQLWLEYYVIVAGLYLNIKMSENHILLSTELARISLYLSQQLYTDQNLFLY